MKVLVFIGLKIAEIIGMAVAVGLLYGIGWVMQRVPGWGDMEVSVWLNAAVSLICLGFILIGVWCFICFIKQNWKWADCIVAWWKYRKK